MRKKIFVAIILIVIFISITGGCQYTIDWDFLTSESDTESSESPILEKCTVIRIVDGDTVWVENKYGERMKVRIIGVDAPETQKEDQIGEYYAAEATQFAEDTLLNKIIYLEKDVSETDKYDRLLRYIWLEKVTDTNEETIMESNFSALLIRNGYAEFVLIGDDGKYEIVLRTAENLAIDDLLGIWEYQ